MISKINYVNQIKPLKLYRFLKWQKYTIFRQQSNFLDNNYQNRQILTRIQLINILFFTTITTFK